MDLAAERARTYLRRFGLEDRIRSFDVPTATVCEAAKALRCDPSRIAKTLAFRIGADVVLVVAAGDVRVDNRKLRTAFGAKGRMLSAEDTLRCTGYAPGGVCPFGVPEGIRVGLDLSLRRFPRVYPACGSANSAVALTPDELALCLPCAVWVDVCRLSESPADS